MVGQIEADSDELMELGSEAPANLRWLTRGLGDATALGDRLLAAAPRPPDPALPPAHQPGGPTLEVATGWARQLNRDVELQIPTASGTRRRPMRTAIGGRAAEGVSGGDALTGGGDGHDDGRTPPDQTGLPTGTGMLGTRERVRLLAGSLTITDPREWGTRVRAAFLPASLT